MADNETTTDIIAWLRKPREGENAYLTLWRDEIADRLDAAHKRETDCIHRAMVLIAGIEMESPEDPPRLWTALEDAYDALSDALETDGDTAADEDEAKATGRHFVVKPSGNPAAMREALVKCREIALQWQADEAAGVAGTTDKPHARSAAEAVVDMEFEINAALAATEKEGGAK